MNMTRNTWNAIAAIGIVGAVFSLAGLWWWALFGMDSDIGLAWWVTGFFVITSSLYALIGTTRPPPRL